MRIIFFLGLMVDSRITIDDEVVGRMRDSRISVEFISKLLPLKEQLFERKEFFDKLRVVLGGEAGLQSWYDNTWRRGLSIS